MHPVVSFQNWCRCFRIGCHCSPCPSICFRFYKQLPNSILNLLAKKYVSLLHFRLQACLGHVWHPKGFILRFGLQLQTLIPNWVQFTCSYIILSFLSKCLSPNEILRNDHCAHAMGRFHSVCPA